MGAECKNVTTADPLLKDALQMQHPVFGNISRLNQEKIDKAIKQIPLQSTTLNIESFMRRVEFSRECDNSVSTLVQIYNYEIQHPQEQKSFSWLSKLETVNCDTTEAPLLTITFQYFPPENSLASILHSRKQSLSKTRTKMGSNAIQSAKAVRLCDYSQIDRLSSAQRQITNLFFQQIQVVRMIDHIVGALYFLQHYQIGHGAVRPETIVLDAEGKYLLVDREVFLLNTNYQSALQNTLKKKEEQKNIEFICPEWLLELRLGRKQSESAGEKVEVFCVGLVALKMCLFDSDLKIFAQDSNHHFTFNEQVLELHLNQIRRRYSPQFYHLLIRMLKIDPQQRIDFAELIDELNPVLLHNLTLIKHLHQPSQRHLNDKSASEENRHRESKEQSILKESLLNMEDQFQRVMSGRGMFLNRTLNEKSIRQEEEYLLAKLNKLQIVRSATVSKEPTANITRKYNPETLINAFDSMVGSHQEPVFQSDGARYLASDELESILWRQYEHLKAKGRLS